MYREISINQLKADKGVKFVTKDQLNVMIFEASKNHLLETILWNFSKNGLAGYLYTEDIWEENFSLVWYVDSLASDEDVQDAWININE